MSDLLESPPAIPPQEDQATSTPTAPPPYEFEDHLELPAPSEDHLEPPAPSATPLPPFARFRRGLQVQPEPTSRMLRAQQQGTDHFEPPAPSATPLPPFGGFRRGLQVQPEPTSRAQQQGTQHQTTSKFLTNSRV